MGSAVANIITLLALYFAALVFAVQHVSDRYSPALNTPMLVRYASVPLAVLVFALAAPAVLLPAEGSLAKVMVVGAILTSLCGSYHLWSTLGDGERTAGLLRAVPRSRREPAVREVLWNAAQRANPRVAAVACACSPPTRPSRTGCCGGWPITGRSSRRNG